MTNATDPFDVWVRDWANDQLGASSVSPKSREVCLRGAGQLLTYLRATHPELREPGALRTAHVAGWLSAMAEGGLSTATLSVRLKAVSLWCKGMVREGDAGLNTTPCDGVPRPRVIPPVIQVPEDDLLRKVIAGCEGTTFVDRRDVAVIRLLADAGLRRSEIARLDVEDADIMTRRALVHGKGGRARVVAFSPKTATALSRYARARGRHAAQESAAFFLPTRGYRLTGGGIAELLARRCRAVGVDPIHPHALRHAATHALLSAGATEQDVEEQMGWTGGAMVRRHGAELRRDRSLATVDRLATGDRL